MIRNTLIAFIACVLILLVIVWFWYGGLGTLARGARAVTDSTFGAFFGSGTSTSLFHLPWQPENMTRGPELIRSDESPADASTDTQVQSAQETPEEAQARLDAQKKKAEDARNFGAPSPYAGEVRIGGSEGATVSDPAAEYVEVAAAGDLSAPIDITDWSLQSAVTGVRAYIPRAASPLLMGTVNAQKDIYLNPGASAILSSGISPVGTSFQENICSGYLSQLQAFTPSLSNSCPPPSEALSLTADNVRAYGDTCFDFLRSLPQCEFPLAVPSNISATCRAFAVNTFSYNGCVNANRGRIPFALDSWRIYFSSGRELWRDTHDVIRLLDKSGRTVDVLTY